MRNFASKKAGARVRTKITTALLASAVALLCGTEANAGGKLTFQDNFDTLSLWDGHTGTWGTDFWYDPLNGPGNTLENNGEQEWYINSNFPLTQGVKPWTTTKDGKLILKGRHAPKKIQSLISNYKYTSGELNSYHSFSQTYGYFEMRAKLPTTQGVWPAFWLLPADGSWPPEIDIMEVLGNSPTTLYTSAHSQQNGKEVDYGTQVTVPDTSQDYHTYACDWEADYITWYFDGKQVYKLATPPDMHKPMFIEVNLALGGNWGGKVDGTTMFPSNMFVDYIRVYSSKP
ncbi:MAG: glycoside hydrolase family 16 protein [Alphaproteobacteria bacterium]|nr:glycoside hydrolase family 16 protein [Alphaproteobacteria bacterium]